MDIGLGYLDRNMIVIEKIGTCSLFYYGVQEILHHYANDFYYVHNIFLIHSYITIPMGVCLSVIILSGLYPLNKYYDKVVKYFL